MTLATRMKWRGRGDDNLTEVLTNDHQWVFRGKLTSDGSQSNGLIGGAKQETKLTFATQQSNKKRFAHLASCVVAHYRVFERSCMQKTRGS